MARLFLLGVLASGVAAADPAAPPTPPPIPVQAPQLGPFQFPRIQLPPISLRLEAARIAADRFAETWRYPEPGPILGRDGGAWFTGVGYYQPRTPRAAALHGGAMAATLVGEILMSANSPLAGVGAMLTGATLDAATADADRAAEARRR